MTDRSTHRYFSFVLCGIYSHEFWSILLSIVIYFSLLSVGLWLLPIIWSIQIRKVRKLYIENDASVSTDLVRNVCICEKQCSSKGKIWWFSLWQWRLFNTLETTDLVQNWNCSKIKESNMVMCGLYFVSKCVNMNLILIPHLCRLYLQRLSRCIFLVLLTR